MKIVTTSLPKSSFLSVDKDIEILVDHFLKNDRLLKLLFYDTPQALAQKPLTQEQKQGLLNHQIKIVPKLKVDQQEFCYIIISFDNFTPNMTNTEFRDNIISFDIICHFNQWNLGNFALRPYKIAAEIDSMFNNKKLTGIGTIHFLGANQIILSDELAGLSLMYRTIHGYQGEDSYAPLQPGEDADIKTNWNKVFNIQDGI